MNIDVKGSNRIDWMYPNLHGGSYGEGDTLEITLYHVRAAANSSVKTTTKILPQITLRFEGTDSTGAKFAFDVALDKLMVQPKGMAIGRAADQCDLVLAHATVSRRHAKLSFTSEALQIEDLGSTNGTAVNGTVLRAGEPAALHAGNKLRLGDVELLVRQA